MQQDPTSHVYCSLVLLPAASTLVLASYMVSVPHCRFVIQWSAAAAMRHHWVTATCHTPQLASHRLLALHTPTCISDTWLQRPLKNAAGETNRQRGTDKAFGPSPGPRILRSCQPSTQKPVLILPCALRHTVTHRRKERRKEGRTTWTEAGLILESWGKHNNVQSPNTCTRYL